MTEMRRIRKLCVSNIILLMKKHPKFKKKNIKNYNLEIFFRCL